MHRLLLALSIIALCLHPGALRAQPAETVEADVSTRSVAITSSFTGTEIIVFGTVENSRQPSAEAGTYDVVVVVEGTPVPAMVRRKSQIAGLWIPTQLVRFASFPSYYAIASTRPIDEFADSKFLSANEIGFEYIRIVPSGLARMSPNDPESLLGFRDAVIRLKQKDHLYQTSDFGVTFIGRSLFRATIQLPPNIPVGPLTARVYLLREGQVLSEYKSTVVLSREGIERYIHDRAIRRPVLYGIATVLMASLAGIAAAYLFRRIV